MARFLHLSDLHVVPEGQLVSGQLDTAGLLRVAIDTLIDRLDAIGPVDAVLVTGDISDDGSAESYKIARRELERLGHRLLVVPGNHDDREAFRVGFSNLPEMRRTGLIDWVADIGDTCVIGLDTLIDGKGGGVLRDESLALLSEALAGAGGRRRCEPASASWIQSVWRIPTPCASCWIGMMHRCGSWRGMCMVSIMAFWGGIRL
jgi:3',5'-cyclic AMP phosphodiesterase CpdA